MTKEAYTYSASGEVGSVRQRRTRWERTWLDLKKAPPTAIFGMIVIFGYAVVSIFAPMLAPFGEADSHLVLIKLLVISIFLELIKLAEISYRA